MSLDSRRKLREHQKVETTLYIAAKGEVAAVACRKTFWQQAEITVLEAKEAAQLRDKASESNVGCVKARNRTD